MNQSYGGVGFQYLAEDAHFLMQMRERGIAIFGSAYRSLSADVAIALLFMRGVGMDSLLALLKTCAEQGMLPAQHAFSAAQMADAAGPQVLVFRA